MYRFMSEEIQSHFLIEIILGLESIHKTFIIHNCKGIFTFNELKKVKTAIYQFVAKRDFSGVVFFKIHNDFHTFSKIALVILIPYIVSPEFLRRMSTIWSKLDRGWDQRPSSGDAPVIISP